MNIEILDEAQQDLLEGFHFDERIEMGLGSYFFNSLLSDIDSLVLLRRHSPHRVGILPCAVQAISFRNLLPVLTRAGSGIRRPRLSAESHVD